MYQDYDHIRFVYETEIRRYESNALDNAADKATFRSLHSHTAGEGAEHGFAYRVIDNHYSYTIDAEREEYGTETKLEIVAFPVIKITPTGFRICRGCRGHDGHPETRFISTTWRKQWASRSPEEAVKSYIARRKRQASIYEARAATARSMVQRAEHLLTPDAMPVL